MQKWDKQINQATLDNEKEVLEALKKNYEDSLEEINTKIAMLLGRQDADMQHVIYQVEYQKALKTQIEGILDMLQANEFETISEYLTKCYDEGFQGALYSMQAQGVPFAFPIDQEQVVKAIQHDTMLSETLYESLGKDIEVLNKQIASEISRGISTGAMYGDMARNINGYARIGRNNAMRIARTEGHRIQSQANYDAQVKAKSKGADIVKIWSAALDAKTRDSHFKLDGQVKEIDEPFVYGKNKAMFPGEFGVAHLDINCRCRAISKARWLLDEDQTKMLGDVSKMSEKQKKDIAKKLGMKPEDLAQYSNQIVPVKSKDYKDFKRQYDKLWRYEGSDLQKEAEERIAGYEKAKKNKKTKAQIEDLEKQFSDLADGYSYDDFIDEFGSIENGFEGASVEEIKKAKQISEKIKSLRGDSYTRKQPENVIHTKKDSIEILKAQGIDFVDKSSGSISAEVLSKYTDFITDFGATHPSYFNRNKLKLESINIVDSVKGHKYASGRYKTDNNTIEVKLSSIKTTQSRNFAKTDDPELYVFAHEYGHYIDNTLDKFKISGQSIVQSATNRYYNGDIFKSPKDLKDILSPYGSTNYAEAFAEAFAEAYTSEEPREFAKIFKEELEKALAFKG